MGKWWSWVPGFRDVALKKCRPEALSTITGERLFVYRMTQRQRPDTEILAAKLRDEVLDNLERSIPPPKGPMAETAPRSFSCRSLGEQLVVSATVWLTVPLAYRSR